MQGESENQTGSNNTSTPNNDTVIVKTDENAKNGLNRCPMCGSTDIQTNVNNGKLRCNFCRHEFEGEKVTGLVENISELKGQVIASGAQDIIASTDDVMTFKCSSCGAEVVIDTSSSSQARCHWCRNTLSINQQIPNGTIPDVVLPFNVTKDDARKSIDIFVSKRRFFANPTFKKEFTSENIMGVYFPYMLVDINSHVSFSGEGEHQTRKYYRGTGNSQRAYYDADLYQVEREFDLTINGLSVESNSDRLNNSSSEKTNNVINAIMPFDVENCVKYDSNYLKGYTSEKRDVNIDGLKEIVNNQSKDVARFAANETLKNYDRGVRWDKQNMDIKGQQWTSSYLPVWLYSYQEVKGDKKLLHYVAVNARTKETMGSVPIHMPKLILFSTIIEIIGIILMLLIDFDENWVFLVSGVAFYFAIYAKYRNSNARHTYETETKKEMSGLRQVDNFLRSEKGLDSPRMIGANNTYVSGQTSESKLLDKYSKETLMGKLVQNNSVIGSIQDLKNNNNNKKV